MLAAAAPAHADTRFEANAGSGIRWSGSSRGRESDMVVTDRGVTVSLTGAAGGGVAGARRSAAGHGARRGRARGEIQLLRRRSQHWRTGVANFARVRTHEQVPGVDVVWHGGKEGLEYDIEVAAGVDARQLAFAVTGSRGLRVTRDGSLEIATLAGRSSSNRRASCRTVARFPRVIGSIRGACGSTLDGYDASAPVLIDPVVKYSTYLGGSASETALAVAADAGGNAYLTGQTSSTNFPKTAGAALSGTSDAYVAKLAPDGATLIYATYIGGNADEHGSGIAVDAAGHAYITGDTTSSNFPATAGAFQTARRGAQDTFVVELSPAGDALAYATYLGGNNDNDYSQAIAIDAAGNAYATGWTESATWPTTTGAFLTSICGTAQTTASCAYVTKIAAGGGSLAYSTFLGALDLTTGAAIAVDSTGAAYVTGRVLVTANAAGHFPTTTGAFQTTCPTGTRGYLAKLAPDGKSLAYGTYLHATGAGHTEDFRGVAVDSAGNAYVAGESDSTTWVTTAGAYQTTSGGANDVIVAKLNSAGSALVYSTYIGGSSADIAAALAIDAAGNAYVSGYTMSTNFPTTSDAPEPTFPGSSSYTAFAAELDATGASLVYGTYLGGNQFTQSYGIAVDAHGATYVAGYTSGGYPTSSGSFQSAYGGSTDAFLTKLVGGHNADGCAGAPDCLSGNCVDGVCCDTACTDECAACDVAGNVGTCTPVTGAPHGNRAACISLACACDGTDTAKCTNNGAECDIGVCTDDHTLGNPDGTTTDCTPFKCAASGACATSCANVDDCVAPNICDPDGKCIPLPPQVTPGGCGCGAAPAGWSVWWIGIVGYALLRRRRR